MPANDLTAVLPRTRRVAAIGLDAAEWADAQALIAEGALPNLEKLVRRSARAELEVERPYRAEAVWTEFFSGRPPSDTGYWGVTCFDPATYGVWNQGASTTTPFHARPDVRTIVFDVPNSALSADGTGLQVTGWGAHSPQYPTASSPADLVARIDERFGVHRAVLSDSDAGWHNEQRATLLADALVDGARTKSHICEWLLEEQPDWDLFCVVFSEVHTAGHQFLHGIRPDHPLHDTVDTAHAARHFREVWSAVDEAVGILAGQLEAEDTTLVLFALHGMEPNAGDVTGLVLLPELLHRLSFGTPFLDFGAWDPDMPPIVPPPDESLEERLLRLLRAPQGAMGGKGALKNRLAWEARRRLPDRLLARLERAWRRASGASARDTWWELEERPHAIPILDITAETAWRPIDYMPASWYCARWPEMQAFSIPSFSDAHIRINLAGREAAGIVAMDDYVATLDEVEAALRATSDARTGAPLVADVHRTRADDPCAPGGPPADLVVTFAAVTDAIHHPDVGVIGPAPFLRPGEHSPNGWVLVCPPGGASGALGTHRPADIGPTLLDLIGRPASPLCTGTSFADRIPTS